tara:strand:+ start:248 stop:1204 length:957 start_codon:yes stop_codon:yes gene_type:complete
MLNLETKVLKAAQRIEPHIRETYFERSKAFSELLDGNVWFKLEDMQYTGSFKARGAMNKLLTLVDSDKSNGVITASTGNHGAGVAFAAKKINLDCTIYVPEGASEAKIANMNKYDANIVVHGIDSVEAEKKAREISNIHKMTYIPPYNDIDVIAGQGTIGFEIEKQSEELNSIIIAVGGGGLISGIASYLKSIWPNINIIGCSPKNSAVMLRSIDAGHIVNIDSESTLSDGTGGGVESESITFPLCCELIDEKVLLTEEEIKNGMISYIKNEQRLLEGSAGLAVAALIKKQKELRGQKIGVIICGGNISIETIRQVLN